MVQFNWGGLASPTEMDVPKCSASVKGCSLVDGHWVHHTNGTWTVDDMLRPGRHGAPSKPAGSTGVALRTMHGHCHAPTCIAFEVYIADTMTPLCKWKAAFGEKNSTFHESGYIHIPPCVFGSPEDGLVQPVPLKWGTMLFANKTTKADNGHHGEMTLVQTYGEFIFS